MRSLVMSRPGRRGRLFRRVAVVLATVLATGALASASSGADGRHDRLDLTSIAISSSAQPQVRDNAFDSERLLGRTADAETSSSANAECDGCTATATTLGIVYVDAGRAANLENVATAWDSCANCTTASVSVQVVVVRRAQRVTANNRALALNVDCQSCRASAAAYLIVLLEPHGKRLSGKDVQALQTWVQGQANAMTGASQQSTLRAAPNASSSQGALSDLQQRLQSALGASTLAKAGEVKTG
jgi:hypothetical protein